KGACHPRGVGHVGVALISVQRCRPVQLVGAEKTVDFGDVHPLAMAGVAEHSDFRNDPWGRLARTSTFLAVTTFGTADDAQR
ncbi:hypothetical protein C6A85_10095, partial [Mycobacterium sp. ITM-2017-0098]